MTEEFLLAIYDIEDLVFLTRGHFLSNDSLGTKKRILKQNTKEEFRLKRKGSKRKREENSGAVWHVGGGGSGTSLKCKMRSLQR